MPMTNNPNMNKRTNLKLCSLNCRSLSKPSIIETSQSFSRYLARETGADILCLQETHVKSPETQERIDLQLQAHQSIWTEHCGIVFRNPNITIESTFITPDQRAIFCKVVHVNKQFPSFNLLNIYAPTTPQERYQFYAYLLSLDYFRPIMTDIHASHLLNDSLPSVIVGDFNYNFRNFPHTNVAQYLQDTPAESLIPQPMPPSLEPSSDTEDRPIMPELDTNDPSSMPRLSTNQWLWHWIMTQHYEESTHKLQTDPYVPTFRRSATMSTIDYLFLHPILASFITSSDVEFINNAWTDHALLSVQLKFESPEHGNGIWRANPHLATNSYFIEQLNTALTAFMDHRSQQSDTFSAQFTWDDLKALTATVARRVGRSRANWRRRQLKRLYSKRNRLLRIYKDNRILQDRLPIVEQQIGILQQEAVDIFALRSGLRWRENGETSAGVLKRLIKYKAQQRMIPTIQHPITGVPCEAPYEKRLGAQQFYQDL